MVNDSQRDVVRVSVNGHSAENVDEAKRSFCIVAAVGSPPHFSSELKCAALCRKARGQRAEGRGRKSEVGGKTSDPETLLTNRQRIQSKSADLLRIRSADAFI